MGMTGIGGAADLNAGRRRSAAQALEVMVDRRSWQGATGGNAKSRKNRQTPGEETRNALTDWRIIAFMPCLHRSHSMAIADVCGIDHVTARPIPICIFSAIFTPPARRK